MILSYRRTNSALSKYNLGRVNILRFKDKSKVNEFCSAIEKAVSSDSLLSCDDWDARNLGVTDACKIQSALLETDDGKYGYDERGAFIGFKMIHGIRYLSGDSYSSFVSAVQESADPSNVIAAEAFLAAFDDDGFYENSKDIVSKNDLTRWSAGIPDIESFLSDLISEVTYTVKGVMKVVLLAKPSVLSDENYVNFVMYLLSHSSIDLCVLTDSGDLGRVLAENGVDYSVIE